jgi:hypothetical protein
LKEIEEELKKLDEVNFNQISENQEDQKDSILVKQEHSRSRTSRSSRHKRSSRRGLIEDDCVCWMYFIGGFVFLAIVMIILFMNKRGL